MITTNCARNAPKISDRGGGPMSPWVGTPNFGDGGGQVLMGGGATPGWGWVPHILDNPGCRNKIYKTVSGPPSIWLVTEAQPLCLPNFPCSSGLQIIFGSLDDLNFSRQIKYDYNFIPAHSITINDSINSTLITAR